MIAILVALLAQPNLDAALDAMVAAKDAASYVAARDDVLAMGRGALPSLEARGAADQWTAEGWVRALAAEACRLRIVNPELAAAVDRPRGLDPATYRQFRRPEPMIVPELSRLGPAAVPLLLERWRWTFEAYPFSDGEAGQLERTAFRHGILEVLGQVGDPRSRPFLEDWAWDARGRELAATADRIRGGCAEALVEALRRHPDESQAIGTALAVTAWPPSVAAVESLASDRKAGAAVRAAAQSVLEPLKRAVAGSGLH